MQTFPPSDLVFHVILENPTIVTELHCNGFDNGGCYNNSNSNGATTNSHLHHHHPPRPNSSSSSNGPTSIMTTPPVSTMTTSKRHQPSLHHPGHNHPGHHHPSHPGADAADAEAGLGGGGGIVDSLTPTLGETFRLTIRIRESKEYKSTVDKLLKV